MLKRFRKWLQYRRLVRTMADDWIIHARGVEYTSGGALVARYVVEQNGLGERRVRVVWRHHDLKGIGLSSHDYTAWLQWCEEAQPTYPPRPEWEAVR